MGMNFYSFCNDAAIQVFLDYKPVHTFFKPDYFLEYGTNSMRGEMVLRNQIVDMKISDFLGLAEPIPADDRMRHNDQKEFLKDVKSGKKTDWDIPVLIIKETEDENWKVIGHDGRHRAMILASLGYKEMPVRISIPESTLLNNDNMPKVLWCQNDKSLKREKYKFPFPITKENYNEPYIQVEGLMKPSVAKDEGGAEATIGMAPSYCVEAKRNFEKNQKKPLIIPFNTYYEFMMRKKP